MRWDTILRPSKILKKAINTLVLKVNNKVAEKHIHLTIVDNQVRLHFCQRITVQQSFHSHTA